MNADLRKALDLLEQVGYGARLEQSPDWNEECNVLLAKYNRETPEPEDECD